jgi:hypothetical protein
VRAVVEGKVSRSVQASLVAAIAVGLTAVVICRPHMQQMPPVSPTETAMSIFPALASNGNAAAQNRILVFEEARDIATVFAAIVGIVPLFLIFLNLKASQQTIRSKVALDALSLFEGRDGENLLLERLVKDAHDRQLPFDINNVSQKDRETLHQLARAWDMAGLLVKHQVMPIAVLFDFYSLAIVRAWQHLKHNVDEERKGRNQEGYMRKFEVIAIGAALYRKKVKNERPQFEIDKETEAEWKRWERNGWKK